MTHEWGKYTKLASYTGQQLLGLPLRAPHAIYPVVYTLPLLTISMLKGTGVVTSVPSDAPDDYAALRDLQLKPKVRARCAASLLVVCASRTLPRLMLRFSLSCLLAASLHPLSLLQLREKFGIADHMVAFDIVEIIEIPGYGRSAAVTVCEAKGIQSQNDTQKLAEAKEEVYLKGFYEGVLLVGSQAGKRVCDAKDAVRAEMIANGFAAPYWEPEKLVSEGRGGQGRAAYARERAPSPPPPQVLFPFAYLAPPPPLCCMYS